MRQYDLIGCGALNLDLIYRLPADSPLWGELPPPGAELAVAPDVREHLQTALDGLEPARSGGGQAANTSYALARRRKRKLKRLYDRRGELLRALKVEYERATKFTSPKIKEEQR